MRLSAPTKGTLYRESGHWIFGYQIWHRLAYVFFDLRVQKGIHIDSGYKMYKHDGVRGIWTETTWRSDQRYHMRSWPMHGVWCWKASLSNGAPMGHLLGARPSHWPGGFSRIWRFGPKIPQKSICTTISGWWFGTCFPYIGNNHPNWLIFFQRGSNHQPDLTWACIILYLAHPPMMGLMLPPFPDGESKPEVTAEDVSQALNWWMCNGIWRWQPEMAGPPGNGGSGRNMGSMCLKNARVNMF